MQENEYNPKPIEPEQLFEEIRDLLDEKQKARLRKRLHDADAADLAEIVEMLDGEEQELFMAALDAEEAGEVLSMVDWATRGEIVEDMSDQTLTGAIASMAPDDAADVLANLTEEQSTEVLEHLPPDQAAEVAALMKYEEDTAGGLMTPEFLSVAQDVPVATVVSELREMELDAEEPFFIYVVDKLGRLLGLVPVRKLITAPSQTPVSKIMTRDVVSVSVDDDQEEVVNVIRRYDLPAVPVLDKNGRLVGRVTHDDVADVIFEEADEDMLLMAGTDAAELERSSPLRAARVRMSWLLPCLIGTLLTGLVMWAFESPIGTRDFMVLVLFVPMIAAMGGNSGIQASTIIIRGLATQEMAGESLALALRREAPIAVLVGCACGILAGVVAAMVVYGRETYAQSVATLNPTGIGLSVGLAMLLAILVAVSLGTLLPFGFRRVGIDPAIASGPLITTGNDIISVTIYLSIGMLAVRLLQV